MPFWSPACWRCSRDAADQQIPMETASLGPRSRRPLGGLTPRRSPTTTRRGCQRCAETPAVHRFPGSMAKRIQDLARWWSTITTATPPRSGSRAVRTAARSWCGSAVTRIWRAESQDIPGAAGQAVRPDRAAGWREAAGDYGKTGTFMSVADVRDKASLDTKVRSYKEADEGGGQSREEGLVAARLHLRRRTSSGSLRQCNLNDQVLRHHRRADRASELALPVDGGDLSKIVDITLPEPVSTIAVSVVGPAALMSACGECGWCPTCPSSGSPRRRRAAGAVQPRAPEAPTAVNT